MRSRRGSRQSSAGVLADPAALRSLTAAGDVARLALGRLAIAPGSKPRQIGNGRQRKASPAGEAMSRLAMARQPVSVSPLPAAMLQRKCGGSCHCDACAKKARQAARTAPSAAPPIVRQVLNSAGQPLDTATRGAMEQRFGHDFGRVRIHADGKADASARAVGASAYAVGPHIVFARGQYAPATKAGEMVLAHELTHVLQQPVHAGSGEIRLGEAGDAHEREANSIATQVMGGASAKPQVSPRSCAWRPARRGA